MLSLCSPVLPPCSLHAPQCSRLATPFSRTRRRLLASLSETLWTAGSGYYGSTYGSAGYLAVLVGKTQLARVVAARTGRSAKAEDMLQDVIDKKCLPQGRPGRR